MNKEMLIILADYYPAPSSNTNCLENLLREMEANGWHLDIITRGVNNDQMLCEMESVTRTVYRIPDCKLINSLYFSQISRTPAPPFLRKMNKCFSFISKSVFYLFYCRNSYESYAAGWDRQAIINFVTHLMKSKKYHVIFSVSFPAKTHEIASDLKKISPADTKWILFEYDPFCYNINNYGKNCYKKLSAVQHTFFQQCDGIFCTPQLFDFYQSTPFIKYKHKMTSIEYANLVPVSYNSKNVYTVKLNHNKINCTYAGILRTDIRDPKYMFRVFGFLDDTVSLLIMTGSDTKPWRKEITTLNKRVIVLPEQTRDTAVDCMLRSDILINIGNTVVYQIPGKIFEYMSTGKPIIHFSKIKQDPCIPYLEKYPFTLIIQEHEQKPEIHAQQVLAFCKKYTGKKLEFDEVVQHLRELDGKKLCRKFRKSVENMLN